MLNLSLGQPRSEGLLSAEHSTLGASKLGNRRIRVSILWHVAHISCWRCPERTQSFRLWTIPYLWSMKSNRTDSVALFVDEVLERGEVGQRLAT